MTHSNIYPVDADRQVQSHHALLSVSHPESVDSSVLQVGASSFSSCFALRRRIAELMVEIRFQHLHQRVSAETVVSEQSAKAMLLA